ncbi:hypothetical protein [Zhongshania sp.]|jgi:hypothetical protein|uniref:hypothetical protein n=1 Tax=Zhongshania sp. TaxID=1971902 RepID=UPI0039E24544
MKVNWEMSVLPSGKRAEYIYVTDSAAQLETELEPLIIACVDKAVSVMPENINDDSLYLIFEFDDHGVLRIVMTDDTKQQESAYGIACDMSSVTQYLAESDYWKFKGEPFADIVKHCIRDYLTTCGAFMRYSLVAVFSEGDRARTELL